MVRFRFAALLAVSLVASTAFVGCFGTPFDKGDSGGTGTGRPSVVAVDEGKTGGMGSPRGQERLGPGELGPMDTAAPGNGAR